MSLESVWSFSSTAFPAQTEPDTADPGRRLLCGFLRAVLGERRLQVGVCTMEDWGWSMHLRHGGKRFWVGCGADQDEPNVFLVFLKATRSVFDFALPGEWNTAFGALSSMVEDILGGHPGIRDLRKEPDT